MSKIKKNLQEVVNIIVALNGCENCYDEDTAAFKPWEVIDILSEFAKPEQVAAIRYRDTMKSKPQWIVPGEYTVKRLWELHTYPNDHIVETTQAQRDAFYKVETHSVFWVNLLDSPWSDSHFVGWKYVVTFPEEAGLSGEYLVRENDLFIKEEAADDKENYD